MNLYSLQPKNWRHYTVGFVVLALFIVVGSSPKAKSDACQHLPDSDPIMSPLNAIDTFDLAFWGKVVIPARKYSLGYCAGIEITESYKGLKSNSTNVT